MSRREPWVQVQFWKHETNWSEQASRSIEMYLKNVTQKKAIFGI